MPSRVDGMNGKPRKEPNMTIRTETEGFAKRISDLGFTVYIAESSAYGFITDASESRVLSFSFNDCGSLGGNYGPASKTSGTGWRLEKGPHALVTAEDVKEALYANPPQWCGKGWKYLSNVAQYPEDLWLIVCGLQSSTRSPECLSVRLELCQPRSSLRRYKTPPPLNSSAP